MLVMRTAEDSTDPVGEFISAQQPFGLYHFSLAVNPLGLYGVSMRRPILSRANVVASYGIRLITYCIEEYRQGHKLRTSGSSSSAASLYSRIPYQAQNIGHLAFQSALSKSEFSP